MGKGGQLELWFPEDDYECRLSKELRIFAKVDLREEDSVRDQALAQFRHWIKKNAHIKKCRMDAIFLLRFLRMKKFSIPMAQNTLIDYLLMRHQHQDWCRQLDIREHTVNDLITRGLVFPLFERDDHGRKVIFSWAGAIDPKVHTPEDVIRAGLLAFEVLLEEEENQVTGFTYILDEKAVGLAHLVLWNPAQVTLVFNTCEHAVPMRHKNIHVLNLHPAMQAMFEFAKSLLSDKIQNRFQIHTNDSTMKKHIDPKILPKEYGGEIPMKVMIDHWKETLSAHREKIMAMDEMDVEDSPAHNGSSPNNKRDGEMFGMNGSFRKLEID